VKIIRVNRQSVNSHQAFSIPMSIHLEQFACRSSMKIVYVGYMLSLYSSAYWLCSMYDGLLFSFSCVGVETSHHRETDTGWYPGLVRSAKPCWSCPNWRVSYVYSGNFDSKNVNSPFLQTHFLLLMLSLNCVYFSVRDFFFIIIC